MPQSSASEAVVLVVQERVAQERQQPKLPDLTPEEEFLARLDHALSTLKLEVWSMLLGRTSNEQFLAALPCHTFAVLHQEPSWNGNENAHASGCEFFNGPL